MYINKKNIFAMKNKAWNTRTQRKLENKVDSHCCKFDLLFKAIVSHSK